MGRTRRNPPRDHRLDPLVVNHLNTLVRVPCPVAAAAAAAAKDGGFRRIIRGRRQSRHYRRLVAQTTWSGGGRVPAVSRPQLGLS